MTIRSTRDLDRRAFLLLGGTTAAALTVGSLTGCGPGNASGQGTSPTPTGSVDAANPLGVPPDEPLEAVIFKGGYGDQYVIDAEAIYQERFPNAEITHQGAQGLGQLLQPRFISGDVPDLICNAGADALPMATLIANDQLADLTPLLDAPALGNESKTVRETLLPGVAELGTYDGTPRAINYGFVVHGIWHSSSLFEKNGWTMPETWDEMLDLCAEIRSTGVYPWTYQGKNPGYILTPILMAAIKTGGMDVIKNIDNLEPGAWTAPAVMESAEAFYKLVERDYILPGTSGMTHTQAQTYWAQGEAVFIPCGSWLESELGDITPEGFDMVVTSTPALTSSDALPLEAIQGAGSEPFIVPAQASNPLGGMELLRILLSAESAANFTEQTQALTSVAEYETTNVGTGLQSVRDALAASGENTFHSLRGQFYGPALGKPTNQATGLLMSGEINPDEWATTCQEAADAVAADDTIPKYHRD